MTDLTEAEEQAVEAAKEKSEKASIVGKTEGPELDKQEDEGPVDQLKSLVDRCVNDNMQVHIIAQKVGILNATFGEDKLDDLDIIDLLAYARDELDKKNNTSNPATK